MNASETSDTMEEVRRIKDQCSLARLSRTPEEEESHMKEVMKRAEARLGRPIVAVDNSRSRKEEVSQV
jgi:hypothetical protein